jgi:hypothetical protein
MLLGPRKGWGKTREEPGPPSLSFPLLPFSRDSASSTRGP